MPVYLDSYAKRMLYSEQPIVLLTRRHLSKMIFTNFEHLYSISNISHEIHDFSFARPSNYLYLFKNHRQIFSWPEERPSSHLKDTKI